MDKDDSEFNVKAASNTKAEINSSVPVKDSYDESNHPNNDTYAVACLAAVLLIIAVVYVASDWVKKQLDRLIEVKGIRLTFSVVMLPLIVVLISAFFSSENRKYLYLLALIISLVTSERSTAITVEKKVQEKDGVIKGKDEELDEIKGFLLEKITEFKDVHLHKLLGICNDRTECSADDVRKQIHEFTLVMMFQSSFLNTIDEIKHKSNSKISNEEHMEVNAYNGIINPSGN